MRDAEIVTAIAAGRTDGLAEAYHRYAPGLHAYCRCLLGEPARADEAVLDTFVVAFAKLGGLRNPRRLRPWLYAVARNECRRQLRSGVSPAAPGRAGEVTDDTVDLAADAEQLELRAVVDTALAELNPGDREIVELSLRHQLTGPDLADTLGASADEVHALMSRAWSQFEASLGALLAARTGREFCPELATMLPGWRAQLNALQRKRVSRHIERCDRCRALRPTLTMMLSQLPPAPIPASLYDTLFRLVTDPDPAAAAHWAHVVDRARSFDASGFPRPLDPPQVTTRPNTHTLAAGAAVAGVAVASVMLFGVYGADSPSPPPPGSAGPFSPAVAPRGVPEFRPDPAAAAGGAGKPARPSVPRIDPGAAGLAPEIPVTSLISPTGQAVPGPTTPVPTPSPSPVQSTPAPAPSTPAPTPSTPAPTPSTPTPTPSTPTPTPSTPTPTPSTPAPTPSTPAPTPSTTPTTAPSTTPSTPVPTPSASAPTPTAT